MLDLSDASIAAWKAKLPDDLRSALAAEGEGPSGGAGALAAVLTEAAPWQVPEVVRRHPDEVRAFGRARRVRLMAWMAGQAQPDPAALLRRLTGEAPPREVSSREVSPPEVSNGAGDGAGAGEGAGSGGDAGGEVGVLFLEDIRALAAALAPRLARRMASGETLEAVVQAAVTLESDMAFRQGGI